MSYHIGYKCNWISLYDDKKLLTTVQIVHTKVVRMLKRGVKLMPTQPDVLSILEKLKQKE